MADFEEFRALTALVEHGSFQVAAQQLGTSRARLRRKLASLEERTGVALMVRVEGVLRPTLAGEGLAESARQLLTEGSLLIAHAREMAEQPKGCLLVAVQVGMPHHVLMMADRMMSTQYPDVSIEVRVAEDPTTLLAAGAEMAIYLGPDEFEVPGCERIDITQFRTVLMGGDAYFKRHGRPTSVDELDGHALGLWRPPRGGDPCLPLASGDRKAARPRLFTSDDRLLRRAATAGDFLALVPNPPFPDPEFPSLLAVLPDEIGQPIAGRMYVPRAMLNVPRVRLAAETARAITKG